MSHYGARRQTFLADDFNHERNASYLRHKRNSIPHIVGVQRSDYRARRRFNWLLSDLRGLEETLGIIAQTYARHHHAPPTSVAQSSIWATVSDPTDTWSANTDPADTWGAVTDPSDTWA